MIVYGLISPHPPIIVPDIGGADIAKVQGTIAALEQACQKLAAAQPDHLVIISPHPDHGFEVPLYYLKKYVSAGVKIERILVTESSYEYYYQWGRQRGAQMQAEKTRYAIVASGDLSHVLKADGPYGYNPAGPVLDKAIVSAIRRGDAGALLNLDAQTLDAGAECGLRSVLFLLGAYQNAAYKPAVLSYEGPFGVGYLVATLTSAQNLPDDQIALPHIARSAIAHYLETGHAMSPPRHLPPPLRRAAGVFVSLHQPNGDLRGCIGTIVPTQPNLAAEVIANAVAAATHDPRFAPVTASELASLDISVDVLSTPVAVHDLAALDPQRFGIIVLAADGRQGVLLPDLQGVTTVDQQIAICREKAGIGPDEPIEIRSFEVVRHHGVR
jgi:AmmeMemoRadiSam system protein A